LYARKPENVGRIETRDAATLLALFLYAEAAQETVRAQEALAATIANQVEYALIDRVTRPLYPYGAYVVRTQLFIECLDQLCWDDVKPRSYDEPAFASCLRIAKRAINGALNDPTQGAARFHKLGNRPAWAAELNPTAWIGSFLFYGDEALQSPLA
jgi:cell wall hydrolase